MSKNTNTTKIITKTSNSTLDIINKIQIESQNLFVFPSDIVSMIIDKIITYFNYDLSNVKCCDVCCGNYEFINKFIKLNVKGINIKYLNNNLIKYYSELFDKLNTNDKNKFNVNYYISKKYSLNDTKHNHLIICNLLNVTRNNEQQIKVINYYNDGYELINIDGKNKRIKTHKANITIHNTYDFMINNWFDSVNEDVNIKLIHNEVLNSMIHYYKHKYNKALIDYMIHENLFNNQNGGRQNVKCRLKGGIIRSWKVIKLRDVIEYVNVNVFDIYCENGIYPLIMNCRVDNGIIGYIDQCSYCDVSITISINNPVICYYHNYPVAIDKSVRLFKIKDKLIDPHLLTVLINHELINRDYEVISIKDIMGIIIYVPVFYDF